VPGRSKETGIARERASAGCVMFDERLCQAGWLTMLFRGSGFSRDAPALMPQKRQQHRD